MSCVSCHLTQCSFNTVTDLCTITCHDQFYCENNFCKPNCHRFREYSEAYTVTSDVLLVVSGSIGILSGGAVLLISCVHRKRMYVYTNYCRTLLTAYVEYFIQHISKFGFT